ncbi:MAG: type II toxin-antitoxin system RelE/ParE family toxin [Planctomycetota bacterium]|nr:MAG: type II toxin-antitoxin system RelE/ParE family toxin [Planctomycetota bacterium]REJ87527.1 MAG: type II toxin-antitoxin system RelE/ParE family toxin [Planctomycetota bacterium]REK31096.1 MAG: type II toxin-antitoxin system RelE/ParE family toxin [Planctomycetota bacterium]REK44342.1 MAG: type II toxin-antitoxin system RelE/ParE family toxin [Planctomycetota bacterium]
MPSVIYSPAAEEDLLEIAAFIARDKPEAARRWLRTIREKCSLIATQPELGESRSGFGVAGCRSFSVGNYVIFFRPVDDGVEISRVVHGHRDLRRI